MSTTVYTPTVTSQTEVANSSDQNERIVTSPPRDITVDIIIYVIVGVFGMFGNAFAAYIIKASRQMMKTNTNVLILNQCLIDLVCSVCVIAQSTVVYDQAGFHGTLGLVRCLLWTSKVIQWSFFISSTANIVALTVEKFLQIRYPIHHRMSFTTTKLGLLITFVWLSGPLVNFPMVIPTSHVDPQTHTCLNMQNWPSESVRKTVGIAAVVLEFFVPLLIIIFCYIQMFRTLKSKVQPVTKAVANQSNPQQSNSQSESPTGETGSGNEQSGNDVITATSNPSTARPRTKGEIMVKARYNVVKTLLTSCICFILCWVWNQVFFLMFNLGYPVDYNSEYYHFTVYMVFLNFCVNPVIYSLSYKQFQHSVKAKFLKGSLRFTTVQKSQARSQAYTSQ